MVFLYIFSKSQEIFNSNTVVKQFFVLSFYSHSNPKDTVTQKLWADRLKLLMSKCDSSHFSLNIKYSLSAQQDLNRKTGSYLRPRLGSVKLHPLLGKAGETGTPDEV